MKLKSEMEVKTVKALLDAAASADTRLNPDWGTYGYESPLHLAARFGHETSVSLLAKASVDIDGKTGNGLTALNLVFFNKVKIDSLLHAGASVTNWIETPSCRYIGRLERVRPLVSQRFLPREST